MPIRVDPVLEAFDDALKLVEDEAQRERFRRVVSAARTSVERSVHDLIAEVVADLDEALRGYVQVDLRYQASGLSVEVNPRPAAELAEEEETSLAGELDRLTLRLPSELKDRATAAAAEAGLSLNSWLVRTVARGITQSIVGRGGRRRSPTCRHFLPFPARPHAPLRRGRLQLLLGGTCVGGRVCLDDLARAVDS